MRLFTTVRQGQAPGSTTPTISVRGMQKRYETDLIGWAVYYVLDKEDSFRDK